MNQKVSLNEALVNSLVGIIPNARVEINTKFPTIVYEGVVTDEIILKGVKNFFCEKNIRFELEAESMTGEVFIENQIHLLSISHDQTLRRILVTINTY
ncbi:MAG: hypothetical protein M3Q80_00275 [bacterium]|nr:hypothetical protein [bacterium]